MVSVEDAKQIFGFEMIRQALKFSALRRWLSDRYALPHRTTDVNICTKAHLDANDGSTVYRRSFRNVIGLVRSDPYLMQPNMHSHAGQHTRLTNHILARTRPNTSTN